eukprot:13313953-Ditylum_brightwellii.AAC.1
MRFRAFGTVYGFEQSIKQERDPNLPATEDEEVNPSNTRALKALKLNAIATCNLTMDFTTKALMGLIYSAMLNDWPSGLTCLVVVALHEKFAPKDLISKVELRREMNAITMKKEDDPSVLFEKISSLENQFNTATFQIAKEDTIATVLEKAMSKYSVILMCEQ